MIFPYFKLLFHIFLFYIGHLKSEFNFAINQKNIIFLINN
jgi:hypothetical protein